MLNRIEETMLSQSVKDKLGKIDPLEQQLADMAIHVKKFGVVGDGIADDTAALQSAFDYSAANKRKIFNDDKRAVFKISSPLYIDSDTNVDLGGAEIRKTNNSLGVGSNTYPTQAGMTDSYAVDAHIILRHANDADTKNVHLKGIYFGSTVTSPWHDYAIFAPRLSQCSFESLKGQPYKFNRLIMGYLWWIIPKLNDIRLDGGTCVVEIMNDGSNTGGSTSIKSTLIVGTDMNHCFRLYGVSYSVFDIPLIDHAKDYAFRISSCEALTLNSPSTEWLDSGLYAYIENSDVTLNSPRAYEITGSTTVEKQLISLSNGSNVVINGGVFKDYKSGTASLNLPLTVSLNSHCVLNGTLLPTNGNNYRGNMSNGSTICENRPTGQNYNKLNGSRTIRQTYTSNSSIIRNFTNHTAAPTDGTWLAGDICYNSSPSSGSLGWVCTAAGTPGTWKPFGLIAEVKQGTAYFSGDGVKTSFTIAHGMSAAPNFYTVQSASAATSEISHVNSDATNLTIIFKTPPPSGSTNMAVRWKAELT